LIQDILTVFWKEDREILYLGGSSRPGYLRLLITPLAFGIFLPAVLGRFWVGSPLILVFFTLLPFLLVGNVVADSFAGERERHTLETLLCSPLSDHAILFGKLLAAMAYGWGLMLVTLLLGLIAVNLVHRDGRFLVYRPDIGVGAVLLSFASAWLASTFGVLISLRSPTVQQAQQLIGYAILLPGILLAVATVALPRGARGNVLSNVGHAGLAGGVLAVAIVFLVFGAGLLIVAMARFQRTRLSLD
jgi:ABC-2 type transport system permease protein